MTVPNATLAAAAQQTLVPMTATAGAIYQVGDRKYVGLPNGSLANFFNRAELGALLDDVSRLQAMGVTRS